MDDSEQPQPTPSASTPSASETKHTTKRTHTKKQPKHATKHAGKAHAKKEPVKEAAQCRSGNDVLLKTIFAVLGIALLVAAYFVGYYVGLGTGGNDGGNDGGNGGAKGTDGTTVITIFSEFECPFSGRFYSQTYGQIKSTYGDKVTFEFVHFPLSFHPNAQKAAEAAECAGEQGKFWEMHDKLFENQQDLSVENYKKWAAELKLDTAKFNTCLDNGETAAKITADIQKATSAGVRGTPSFLINGELVVGAQPFDVFKTKIDTALAGEAPAPEPQAPPAPTKVEGDLTDDDAVKGDKDAPVTIVEFSDYECPFCGRNFQQTLPQINENYIKTGKVKYVFRDFPLSFHPNAQKAAEAAECAGEQGKYWEMHDKLFENQQDLSVENYKKWAAELKLDTAKFNTCLDSGAMADEVAQDFKDGQAYGITGTPGFFINGVKISGAQPYSVFAAAIDAALAEAK